MLLSARPILGKGNKRIMILKNWTKQHAMDYMTAHPDSFYLAKLGERYQGFHVDRWLKARPCDLVVDIGGGVLGGALAVTSIGKRRMLIDYCADEYKKIGKLPEGVETIRADFAKLPLDDNTVDILFAWEVLDHAVTKKHFDKGQKELVRVLKPGGIMFFFHPLRSKPKNCHTVIKTEAEISKGFEELEILYGAKEDVNRNRYESFLYLIATKV